MLQGVGKKGVFLLQGAGGAEPSSAGQLLGSKGEVESHLGISANCEFIIYSTTDIPSPLLASPLATAHTLL